MDVKGYFTDKFCIPKHYVEKIKDLALQYGIVIQDEYPDGWTNGRYDYITFESTDAAAWYGFNSDVANLYGRLWAEDSE